MSTHTLTSSTPTPSHTYIYTSLFDNTQAEHTLSSLPFSLAHTHTHTPPSHKITRISQAHLLQVVEGEALKAVDVQQPNGSKGVGVLTNAGIDAAD